MALQGDLQSFALPDVLRLLAGTGKTGRLGVTGSTGSGDVWLQDGQVVASSVTSSPHAGRAADVVFELLRFDGGSFVFEDGEQPAETGEAASVEEAIGQAEEFLREWAEVESVVPSVHSWVALAPELSGDDVTVSASQWRSLAALGGGGTVRDLGNRFELTDLGASRQVKELVEAGLVELGEPREPSADEVAAAAPASTPVEELSILRAEDGPVVVETSEDALLPEPLPSESTTFEGDITGLGTVDGRSFEAMEEDGAPGPEGAAIEAEAEVTEATEVSELTDAAEPAGLAGTEGASFEGDAFFLAPPDDGSGRTPEEVAADPLDSAAADADGGGEAAEATDATAEAGGASDGGDRDGLMQFLSSVKN